MLKLLKPWVKLMTEAKYQPLFSKLPQRILSKEEWNCFIKKVNLNTSPASSFHKKLDNGNGLAAKGKTKPKVTKKNTMNAMNAAIKMSPTGYHRNFLFGGFKQH
ncbi:MAG: hypothetical protein ABIE74_06830 [Pseudomonadota bacterium]